MNRILTHTTFRRYASPLLALAMIASGGAAIAQGYGGQPQGYGQGPGGWDAPPPEFQEVQRRGFHDGIEGARKDFDNHRPPNPNNRDEYRHPPVERSLRGDYRNGFARGYQVSMNHILHANGGPRPY